MLFGKPLKMAFVLQKFQGSTHQYDGENALRLIFFQVFFGPSFCAALHWITLHHVPSPVVALPVALLFALFKQQASKQASYQALLLSVLAIGRPHRSGLYSTSSHPKV